MDDSVIRHLLLSSSVHHQHLQIHLLYQVHNSSSSSPALISFFSLFLDYETTTLETGGTVLCATLWTLHCKKRKNDLLLFDFLFLDSYSAATGSGFIVRTTSQPLVALFDYEPIFYKPRRLLFAERDIVDAQGDEWVKSGIVEPCSSPYASQVVVVKKKDWKSRVCINYRRLNRKLIKDNYPLPLIDDILDCLQNAKIFTTLDLKNGFFFVAINERSRKFTSFVTHNGQYQFRRMPFGLSTCPFTFMRYINAYFRHLISKSIVLPYMDDVVIPAANESQVLEYLKIVLEIRIYFTAFEDYCKKQNILHFSIRTGLPRSNGQIEKQNSTIIVVLSKLSVDDPEKWYSHVPHLQEILNSTFQRSLNMTPFELLFGTKMKSCQDIEIVQFLNDEITAQFQEQRDALRQHAKKQIYKVQDENRRTYNLRCRQAHKYQLHDLVAIKRTDFGPGLKLKQKYRGPYKVTKVKYNDTYDVEKCDFVDGPSKTSTCAEFMKLWPNQTNST
ncbi:retrovirus-related Pol polyprotein from transposon gypsy [Trichonephila clavipes]|nr:retrovirus-related Pol polyprotein from transposon gypsy [Trichonephila clavipes]